jgi:hypothetical protein
MSERAHSDAIVVAWDDLDGSRSAGGTAISAAAAPVPEPRVYEWLFVGAGISGIYNLGGLSERERGGALLIDAQDR